MSTSARPADALRAVPLADFERALVLNPHYVLTHLPMARANLMLAQQAVSSKGAGADAAIEKLNLARIHAEAVLKIAPDFPSAIDVLGRIESIAFDDKIYQARVTLLLEERYVFPKDSSLKILTRGLLGEQYLGIEAGADEAHLADRERVVATQSAVVLENLISQFLYSKAAEGPSSTDDSK